MVSRNVGRNGPTRLDLLPDANAKPASKDFPNSAPHNPPPATRHSPREVRSYFTGARPSTLLAFSFSAFSSRAANAWRKEAQQYICVPQNLALDGEKKHLYSGNMSTGLKLNEEVLRDKRFPASQIADKIIPYIRKLAETFRPQKIILFGSYAYGKPKLDSDIDLLVVKKIRENPIQEATAMRRALRPLRHNGNNISLDLMVRDPDDLKRRVASGAAFHAEILQKGLLLYEN